MQLPVTGNAFVVRGNTRIQGLLGYSGGREVFLGFASARVLHSLSFPDILNEETGRGYQRRFSSRHSLDFRRYIQSRESATIPLTFNLRPPSKGRWTIRKKSIGTAVLDFFPGSGKVLAQVDCQHRLGHIADLDISLPFMAFTGLALEEEMEIFSIINRKARGLSSSLLDFHEAQLASDLAIERPELFIALYLNDNPDSPWYKQLDLGGRKTSGMARIASLRTVQKAVKRFLNQTSLLNTLTAHEIAPIVRDYWAAIVIVLQDEWYNPRKNVITKGIGVYSLMGIAGDICLEAVKEKANLNKELFVYQLADFASDVDWSSDGPFRGLGGEAGAKEALQMLRSARVRRHEIYHG